MKRPGHTTRLFYLLFTALLMLVQTACHNDEEIRIVPQPETTLGGDVTTLDITLARGDWQITAITTLDGTTMVGDNNQPLKLEGLGLVEFRWFTLARVREDVLHLEVTDNLDGSERGMILHLTQPESSYTETLTIRQQPCTTVYEVKEMTYTLEEGDGETESDWVIESTTQVIHAQQEGIVHFNPYQNAWNYHDFKCDAKDAFTWMLSDHDYPVPVPDRLTHGQLTFADPAETIAYSQWTVTSRHPLQDAPMIEVAYEGGKKTTVSCRILYRELKATYHLTVANPTSGEERHYTGKLIRRYPCDYKLEKKWKSWNPEKNLFYPLCFRPVTSKLPTCYKRASDLLRARF